MVKFESYQSLKSRDFKTMAASASIPGQSLQMFQNLRPHQVVSYDNFSCLIVSSMLAAPSFFQAGYAAMGQVTPLPL